LTNRKVHRERDYFTEPEQDRQVPGQTADDFTKKDIIRSSRENNIRMINFRYVAATVASRSSISSSTARLIWIVCYPWVSGWMAPAFSPLWRQIPAI